MPSKDSRCEECRYDFEESYRDRFLGVGGLVAAYPILRWSSILTSHSCLCMPCLQRGVDDSIRASVPSERVDFARAIDRRGSLHGALLSGWFLKVYVSQCLRCARSLVDSPLPYSGVSRVVLSGFSTQLVRLGYGRVRFLRGICFCAECAADAECGFVGRIPFTELPLHVNRVWMTERGRRAYLDRYSE